MGNFQRIGRIAELRGGVKDGGAGTAT